MELNYSPRLPKDAPIAKGSMKAVLQNSMKLIRNGDGSEELYDFANDRADSVDLAGMPEHQADLKALRKVLDTLAASVSSMPTPAGSPSSTTLSVR